MIIIVGGAFVAVVEVIVGITFTIIIAIPLSLLLFKCIYGASILTLYKYLELHLKASLYIKLKVLYESKLRWSTTITAKLYYTTKVDISFPN